MPPENNLDMSKMQCFIYLPRWDWFNPPQIKLLGINLFAWAYKKIFVGAVIGTIMIGGQEDDTNKKADQ